jgi:NAD(P)-dependent dehydrogenase (short-subunit alcohol dehydrogenase family)
MKTRDLSRLFSLTGRNALVTGGGSGLGQAVAEGFAQFGASVAVVDIDEAAASEVADGIVEDGGRAIALACDVSNHAQVQATVRSVTERLGDIHVLVSNAGIGDRAPAEDMTLDQWHRVLDINLSGAWYFDQAVGVHMIERGIPGCIINMSSITSLVGITTGNANYAATKGALNALTRTLAIEWARFGIRVNAIAPTHVKTALIAQKMEDDPALAEFFLGNIPLGRMGAPEDVVGAAIYLASEAGSLVSGHVLVVDGGHTAR